MIQTVFKVPLFKLNYQSGERNLEKSLRMQSSNNTAFPLPIGAKITTAFPLPIGAEISMFTSEKKHTCMEALTLQGSEVSAEKPNQNITSPNPTSTLTSQYCYYIFPNSSKFY